LVNLSQFNRDTTRAVDVRPSKEGLMGGSSLENDSHMVLCMDHSRFVRAGNIADTWLIVDKNRNGGVMDIPVRWDYRTLQLHPRVLTMGESDGTATKEPRGRRR
jgi:replicative DNA helicase